MNAAGLASVLYRGAALLALGGSFSAVGFAQVPANSERERIVDAYLDFPALVRGGVVSPHWLPDGDRFWFVAGEPDRVVIYEVDPVGNKQAPALDVARLRKALRDALATEPPGRGVPFEDFFFADEEARLLGFAVGGMDFLLDLDSYTLRRVERGDAVSERAVEFFERLGILPTELPSPDGRPILTLEGFDLALRSADRGETERLTTDGSETVRWQIHDARWSPDGRRIAARRLDFGTVSRLPIVSWARPGELEWGFYGPPGGPLEEHRISLIDVGAPDRPAVHLEPVEGYNTRIVGWRPDGSELVYFLTDRERKYLDLMAADPTTGEVRRILRETSSTFVIGAEMHWVQTPYHQLFVPLENGEWFLWRSERDGWFHLYLYDYEGRLLRRLTEGAFPVARVETVDETNGWVYYSAHTDPDRPYDTHLYRTSLAGGEPVRLTREPGEHEVEFVPSKRFFIDTHYAPDRPPRADLRAADGTFLRALSTANIDRLRELGWTPPEEFIVKAADGSTNLHGVLYRPYDFDAGRPYPVVDFIGGGQQVSAVWHAIRHWRRHDPARTLAQLGFVVMILDERGTPYRGKAFQDVTYGQVGRFEIPDRVAALEQLARERPYMDLNRVGVFGGSAGGYFALRAMLVAPEIYRVGLVRAPPTELREWDAWVEPYMGLPERNPDGYEYASNVRLAADLSGRLLLIHGALDRDVPLFQTLRMAGALVEAGKHFDLLILPDHGHDNMPEPYSSRALARYFVEHLRPEGCGPVRGSTSICD